MLTLKSILPFWRPPVPNGEAASAALPERSEDFGKASGFELQFDRLMDLPEATRDAIFATRNCR